MFRFEKLMDKEADKMRRPKEDVEEFKEKYEYNKFWITKAGIKVNFFKINSTYDFGSMVWYNVYELSISKRLKMVQKFNTTGLTENEVYIMCKKILKITSADICVEVL